ncbi:MAG: hypothetical protein HY804_00865 [Nitrospinae bacterium]|nr:hypothetical protein [Nitrospinota bacterium]
MTRAPSKKPSSHAAHQQMDEEGAINAAYRHHLQRALDIFAAKLNGLGVGKELIARAMDQMAPQLDQLSRNACETIIVEALGCRDEKYTRSDYFGRALLFHLEKYFPHGAPEEKRILTEPVHGKLPRQVAAGVAEAIREAVGGRRAGFTGVFARNVSKHTMKTAGHVDYPAFASDGNMRAVVAHVIRRFEARFKAMPHDEGRAWLQRHITSTSAFSAMRRPLAGEEMDLLVKNLFRI